LLVITGSLLICNEFPVVPVLPATRILAQLGEVPSAGAQSGHRNPGTELRTAVSSVKGVDRSGGLRGPVSAG
jgi:hypothetical protein